MLPRRRVSLALRTDRARARDRRMKNAANKDNEGRDRRLQLHATNVARARANEEAAERER